MRRDHRPERCPLARVAGLGLALVLLAPPAILGQLDGKHYSLHGYLRERLSVNTEDPPEVQGDNQFDLSMVRSTLYLEMNLFPSDWLTFTFVGRADGEIMTDYLDTLDEASATDLQDFYNDADLREWYADIRIGDRTTLRLGRQQVVWGRTDFFRGMDVFHGFDYTWRSFLEPENEILRKPLVLANATIEVPEVNGSLQLVLRPGWDRNKDIGNTYDLSGGRWANQPNKGFDFLTAQPAIAFPGVPYNYDHPAFNPDDVGGGVRWTQLAGPWEYSIAYLKTFNLDPVVNTIFNPYRAAPVNGFAEFIYPEIDLVGFTLTRDIPSVDVVARTEFAYTFDQPYNIGTQFLGGALPGFGGIVEKDTLRSMIAFDKQMDWPKRVLGASRPAFFNLQFFDTWIVDFDKADDIVALAGYGAPAKEHTTIGTVILGWNYNNDLVNPTVAAGADLSNGGGFIIPSVQLVWGNHWRLRLEYDWFTDSGNKLPGEIEQDTTLFGYFANNDQLYARLTFQF
jgi:hypothetical protein